MKILMTGVTQMGCNEVKQKRISRWDVAESFVALLCRNGWTIEWRSVTPGEELPSVDAVWINLGAAPDANEPHALGAIWTMHQARARDLPLVVFLEDWQLNKIKSGFRAVAKHGVKQMTKVRGGEPLYADTDAAVRHADAIVDTARQFDDSNSALWRRAVPTVLRFRGWGNANLLRRNFIDLPTIAEIDPTPLILPYTRGIAPNGTRERRWVLASVTKHSNQWVDQQPLTWPDERYGWARGKQPKLTDERAVCEAYARNWGVLSPPYHHAGSGWYRARYVFAAAVGAVLLCGPADAKALGPAYQVSAAQVEGLSDAGLRELAAAQRATLLPLLPLDERETLQQIEAAIRLAAEWTG